MIKRKGVSRKASVPATPRRGAFGDLDLDTVRELARIAAEFDLAEVETDPSGRIRIARIAERSAPASAVAPAAGGSLSLMPAAEKPEERGTMITSPFVGTFYRAPTPEAASFVEVGQSVHKGQVVCIVEAMKLMNEIESEVRGRIVQILVENAQPVEFGQPLFLIEPV